MTRPLPPGRGDADRVDAGAPVAVYAPPGPARRAVVAWASGLADATRTDLHVLVPPEPGRPVAGGRKPPRPPATALQHLAGPLWGPLLARGLMQGAHLLADGLRAWAAILSGAAREPDGRLARVLLAHAFDASTLVVPAGVPGADLLADEATCPVAFVPPAPPRTAGPVAVGALGTTGDPVDERLGDAVLAAGFAAAERRRVPLVVVHAEPVVGTPGESADELRRRVDDLVSARALVSSRVPVELRPTRGDPLDALRRITSRAGLLVVGRSRRGLGAGSPVRALVRGAGCPVLVVPAPEPPHRRRRGRATEVEPEHDL